MNTILLHSFSTGLKEEYTGQVKAQMVNILLPSTELAKIFLVTPHLLIC